MRKILNRYLIQLLLSQKISNYSSSLTSQIRHIDKISEDRYNMYL